MDTPLQSNADYIIKQTFQNKKNSMEHSVTQNLIRLFKISN